MFGKPYLYGKLWDEEEDEINIYKLYLVTVSIDTSYWVDGNGGLWEGIGYNDIIYWEEGKCVNGNCLLRRTWRNIF